MSTAIDLQGYQKRLDEALIGRLAERTVKQEEERCKLVQIEVIPVSEYLKRRSDKMHSEGERGSSEADSEAERTEMGSRREEDRTAEKLFGRVRKLAATGDHKATRAKLLEPMDDDESVIRAFCKGCGMYLHIHELGSRNLARLVGADLPDSLEGLFFGAERCIACDNDFRTVELKRI